MLVDQISIFVENKSGRLCDITGVLSENGVDIRALSMADTTNFGILRLIVNNPEKAETALREAGFTLSRTKVIAVCLPDVPGGMHGALRALHDTGISVEYAYAFITHSREAAFVILRVEDNDRAIETLKKNGIKLMNASEVYSL